jgi:hypothetical protein
MLKPEGFCQFFYALLVSLPVMGIDILLIAGLQRSAQVSKGAAHRI